MDFLRKKKRDGIRRIKIRAFAPTRAKKDKF